MIAFSAFAALLFLSLAKDGEAADWDMKRTPKETVKWLCENHAYGIGTYETEVTASGAEAIVCKLRLPYVVPEEEIEDACAYVHPAEFVDKFVNPATKETACNLETMYICPSGQFPVGHLCFEFHEEEKTFKEAEEGCKKENAGREGRLPDAQYGLDFMKHLQNYVDPRRLGFKMHLSWFLDKDAKPKWLLFGRGLDEELPGQTVEPTSDKASYFCLYDGIKTVRLYEKECIIYKDSFHMATSFKRDTCFMMSPSVTLEENAADQHQHCQWFANSDWATSPVDPNGQEGIDGSLDGTMFEYNYITTPGEKDSKFTGGEKDGWKVINPDKKSSKTMGSNLWAQDRPKMKDVNDGLNTLAVVVPKPLRKPNTGIFYDMPKFFRGHLVCGTGCDKTCAQYHTK